ncbi:MICAL-like protein 2 isoform X2 [Syngnathus acus]|uniref:MICAL-like protein 2 isoform X2 n=1 Tax=Syngnathus acus TaxID=161584 RepID=UPI0018861349|nr:MICAL-like protein 2 isoform X2 [Syngnathus acus]
MSAVKALQQWCRVQCDGYRDVTVTNMTTSFRDGLAFCAIIHKHRPELIDYDSLKKENVYENNNLAFRVAEEQLGIPALLDAEDMVALKVPDRLSILTYVSQYYNYFHGRSPIGGVAAVKRPAEPLADGPSGKKNAPVMAKVFPSSKPAKENNPPSLANITAPLPRPRQPRTVRQDVSAEKSNEIGTLSNKCVSCNKHVHLVQRHLIDGKLYHRNCAKLLAPPIISSHLRDAPSSVPPSTGLTKSNTVTVTPTAPPRLGPSSLVQKPSPLSSISGKTTSPNRPASNPQKPSPPSSISGRTSSPNRPASNSQKPSPPSSISGRTSSPNRPASTPQKPSPLSSIFGRTSSPNRPASNPQKPSPPSSISGRTSSPNRPAPNPHKSSPLSSIFGRTSSPNRPASKPHKPSPPSSISGRTSSPHRAASKPHKPSPPSSISGRTSSPNRPASKPHKPSPPSSISGRTSSPNRPASNPHKPSPPSSISGRTLSPHRAALNLIMAATQSQTSPVTNRPSIPDTTLTTPAAITTKPVAAPRTSATAAKTIQSKMRFFEAERDDKKPATKTADIAPKEFKSDDPVKKAQGDQSVPRNVAKVVIIQTKVDVNNDKAGVKKHDENQGSNVAIVNIANTGKSRLQEHFGDGKGGNKKPEDGKAKAADTAKKLSKEENNNSKQIPKADPAKKSDSATTRVQTGTKETETRRGRVKLKVNPSILSDIQPQGSDTSPLRSRTPERSLGGSKPAPPNTSETEMPTDWRSMLKPVPKETKSDDTAQSSTEVPSKNAGVSQLSEVSLRPVNPPSSQGIRNGDPINTTTSSGSNVLKMKPDFIPKEAIMKELMEIEDNLNQLEKRGVELEAKLRHSEDEGEDDSLMDELMVEWFTLIRNKQVAMRRESELVYIGKTQDLEEQQPSVEQELRKLIEKPEHLKTAFERKREEELMSKLVDIVNGRNAIVEGLDEDRLREEEEDQELNKLMENFSVKKDKPKKKSSISKLFTWGSKKEA